MAVYEFECQSCGKRFEISVAITEHDRLKNRPPACRSVVSAKPSSSLRLSAVRPLASTERFALSETATLTWGGGRPPRPDRCPLPSSTQPVAGGVLRGWSVSLGQFAVRLHDARTPSPRKGPSGLCARSSRLPGRPAAGPPPCSRGAPFVECKTPAGREP